MLLFLTWTTVVLQLTWPRLGNFMSGMISKYFWIGWIPHRYIKTVVSKYGNMYFRLQMHLDISEEIIPFSPCYSGHIWHIVCLILLQILFLWQGNLQLPQLHTHTHTKVINASTTTLELTQLFVNPEYESKYKKMVFIMLTTFFTVGQLDFQTRLLLAIWWSPELCQI